MRIVLRYVTPNRCPETGELLKPVIGDEADWDYWKDGKNGERIPVARPRSRRVSKPKKLITSPPSIEYEETEV